MDANLFPAFIKLANRPCLVVGAGEIASSKIDSLLDAGARVTVVAPRATPQVQALLAAGRIHWIRREFRAVDLDGIFLAIAATSTTDVNRAVFLDAQRRNILCNAVDDPPNCDFYFPAVVRRGKLQIAISTSGESPSLAQRLRIELEKSLDSSIGHWMDEIGTRRREILVSQPPSEERKRLLQSLAQGGPHERMPHIARRRARKSPKNQRIRSER
jgi:precorrin-2 dehydrogenase